MTSLPARGAGWHDLIAMREFIAMDIETTFVAATFEEPEPKTYVISVGAARFLNGTRREVFHTLINPGVAVDAHSSKHNGIRTADLRRDEVPSTPAGLALLDAFLAQFPDADLVFHHAHFDVPHLASAYERSAMTMFDRRVFDTQFIGAKLRVPGIPARIALTTLAGRYPGARTSVTGVPKKELRKYKGLRDAQDTAEVLGWLLAEAAALGIVSFDDFVTRVSPTTVDDILASRSTRRRFHAAIIPDKHIRSCHGRPLGKTPTPTALDKFVTQVAECVRLHCPYVAEKVTMARPHAATLLPRLAALLADAQARSGDTGTLLAGLTPMLADLSRADARTWWKHHHEAVATSAACEPYFACPDCAAERPCPRDVIVQLLTRRALDYGLTARGAPVSLLSKTVKKDLWYGESSRKIDTWPAAGMRDMASHMAWVLVTDARARGHANTSTTILAKAVARGLHRDDPRLALVVARRWARWSNRNADIDELVEQVLGHANSDPGYLELEIWHQTYQRTGSEPKPRPARVVAPVRQPADIELRPPQVRHAFRYQIHRLPETATPEPAPA